MTTLKGLYPEGVPETEIDALVARLTVRAGLRVVGVAVTSAPQNKLAPECLQHAEAAPVNPEPTGTQEEDRMLLKNGKPVSKPRAGTSS